MPDPANEPLPTPNSEEEYVNGVADDGSPLNIISKHLTPPWGETEKRPPIGTHAAGGGSPQHIEFDKKTLEAERAHIARVRKSVALMEGTVDMGDLARQILAVDAQIELETKRRHLERLKNAPIEELVEGEGGGGLVAGAPAGPRSLAHGEAGGIGQEDFERPGGAQGRDHAPAPLRGADSSSPLIPMACGHGPDSDGTAGALPASAEAAADRPENARTRSRATHPPSPRLRRTEGSPLRERAPRVRHIPFSAAVILAMALRAAKDLPKLSAELRDLEARLLPAETEIKLKQEFYFDRAFCVVNDMLNSMDEAYKTLGFGNWMPFRFTTSG